MKLEQKHQLFLEEVLAGINGYGTLRIEQLGRELTKSEASSIVDDLEGVVIDAAHFNNVEGTPYEVAVAALVHALKDCIPASLPTSVKLIEGMIARLLERYEDDTLLPS